MSQPAAEDSLELLKLAAMVSGEGRTLNSAIVDRSANLNTVAVDPKAIARKFLTDNGLVQQAQQPHAQVMRPHMPPAIPQVAQVPINDPARSVVGVPIVSNAQEVGELYKLISTLIGKVDALTLAVKESSKLNEKFAQSIEKQLQGKAKQITIKLKD